MADVGRLHGKSRDEVNQPMKKSDEFYNYKPICFQSKQQSTTCTKNDADLKSGHDHM